MKLFVVGCLLLLPLETASCTTRTREAPTPAAMEQSAVAKDGVVELIARGRAELEAGRGAEAQKIFEDAAAEDGDSLRTRVWVIRSWMDQGRINDSLDAIDALDKAGAKGPPMDYLYGMAFAAKARDYMNSGTGGAAVQMSLEDAVIYLDRAVQADPELARDAFLPLADAAWYARRLAIALPAAERAVAREPASADAHFMLGRIALAQFAEVKDDASQKTLADARWETARAAFVRAAELVGTPGDAARAETLARVRTNLGHTYVWREQLDLAQREYAEAISWKPDLVDLSQIRSALGPERFLAALEQASQALASRPRTAGEASAPGGPNAGGAAGAAGAATLDWWLGWARYEQKQYEKADQAFSAAVAANPAFVNAWYYIALSRYHRQDYEGALGALRRNWDEDPADLVASLGTDADLNLRVLDFLVNWCAGQTRNAEAAFLSEVQTGVSPQVSRYWNNVGLFWRDAGEAWRDSGLPEDEARAPEAFEKSWAAYSKALELEPENPAYLNDAAVILHYYLDRDLERAKEMYVKSAERARVELERKDLSASVRDLYEIALRDSTNNLRKLERGEKTN